MRILLQNDWLIALSTFVSLWSTKMWPSYKRIILWKSLTENITKQPPLFSMMLYSRKVWRIWQIIHDSSSKLVLTINNLLADLLNHQTFFCQMLGKSQFTKLSPAKLSHLKIIISFMLMHALPGHDLIQAIPLSCAAALLLCTLKVPLFSYRCLL